MLALEKGDALTVAGPCRPTEWESGEGTKHGIGLTAHRVMSAYTRRETAKRTDDKPKQRKVDAWAIYDEGDDE
jgi:hypothetical protein